MPKKKEKTEVELAVISNEMLKKCKEDIAKFGFTGKAYDSFLVSVCAMKENGSVVKLPNSDLTEYREKFLKKHEYSIGDAFMIDKFKIKSTDHNGHRYDTGYFLPRGFWDMVLDGKVLN